MIRFVLVAAALVVASVAGASERRAAFAGRFYPADSTALAAAVRVSLAQAAAPRAGDPVAIVAPHAGYVFCADIMGEAFRQVEGREVDVVVLLGTNHTRAGLSKAAVWTDGAWRTPLGAALVDLETAEALLDSGSDVIDDRFAHTSEHSIEVLLPFVQTVLPGVPIVPVVVGSPETSFCERVGREIARAVGKRRALVVASSDLAHYPSSSDARRVDRATLDAMATLDVAAFRRAVSDPVSAEVDGLLTFACGEAPAAAAMAAAKALGATRGDVVAYANSGDIPGGDVSRAVGYGAVVFSRSASGAPGSRDGAPGAENGGASADDAARPLGPAERRALLEHARRTLETHFAHGSADPAAGCASFPSIRRGAFVTLTRDGELRGCVGRIASDRPVCEVVGTMALEAVLRDARFRPLERSELARTRIEISVLTPAVAVAGPEAIVVGRDGVVLRKQGRSAVFLPQVATEQGWDRDTFLSQLARKAGLPADAWRSGAEFFTFQAEVFGEAGESP